MAKTEKSLKAEKIIEKLINMNNVLEVEDVDAMGQDVLVKVTIKFDSKTDIDEIDDDFIEKHNKIHGIGPMGSLNRISHGVKFYGTVYVQIVKLVEMWFDEDDIEQESTNINPQKDDLSWGVRDEVYDQLLTRLYKFLPDSLYDIDVDFTFKRNGI